MTQTHGTWGDRTVVYQNSTGMVTVLTLKPHKRCSWHYHKTAYNRFYVIRGILGVKTENGLSKIWEGQSFEVAPGLWHEFQTYEEDTIIVEVCYVKYDPSDITRDRLGGDMDTSEG